MPGLLDIIESVATNPEVDSSIEQLINGLFSHFKDALATGNSATVNQAIDDATANVPQMIAAVTANTPVAPPPPPAQDTASGDGGDPTAQDTTSGGAAGEDTQPAA